MDEKSKYKDLLSYLKLIIDRINNCVDELEKASYVLNRDYLIDNISNEKNKIDIYKENLIKMRDDTLNIVIPQIEQMISDNNNY